MGIRDLLMWTIVGALVVLLVTNAPNVATIISAFGKFWFQETSLIAGRNATYSG